NGLAAVALPGGDSHLLSNVRAVEVALIKRLSLSPGERYPSLGPEARLGLETPPVAVEARFDGYARGRHIVNSVHVLWRPARVKLLVAKNQNIKLLF
ncbi:MAG: hypothetical protein RIS56_1755, partial [Verrucomicrobiota bacterium]